MERKNYFELLRLPFDPPEGNEGKFSKALDAALAAWKQRTQDALNNCNGSKKAEFKAELDLESDIRSVMGEKKSRMQEARALKNLRISQLEQLLDILLTGRDGGTPEVTSVQIHSVQQRLNLSEATVVHVFTEKGFTVRKKNVGADLKDIFLPTSILNSVQTYLQQLHAIHVPGFPAAATVQDLYEFICCYSGHPVTDTAKYRRMPAGELQSIFEAGAIQFSSDISTSGHQMADIFQCGSTQVFCSETTRKQYDRSLKRLELRDFFAQIKGAPEAFKRDHFFAESCIRTIQRQFPDYNVALALYNKEAGIDNDPYEQEDPLIHVSCAACHTPAQFHDLQTAMQAKCSVCGASLYVECPRCHKKAPASADRCACGFLLMEMPFFERYLERAQSALKAMELTEAQRQLDLAKAAYPGHPKLAAVEKQLSDEKARYQKPLDDLNVLINGRMFEQAQALLTRLAVQMPQLRLESQRKLTAERLDQARRLMPGPSVPPSEAANRCVEVLRLVEDFSPARERLAGIQPQPPRGLRFSVQDMPKLSCSLSWSASGDSGVAYKIVRKANGVPGQHADGEILADKLSALEYRDSALQPGVSYGYAVFACRGGVYSAPAVCEVINYSELDPAQLQAVSADGSCQFSWTLPKNCIGVRVLRSPNAIPPESPDSSCDVLAKDAVSGLTDTAVQNGTRYGYRLQCVYPYGSSVRYSQGRTVLLMPEEPPAQLRSLSARVDERVVTVRWNCDAATGQTVTLKAVPDRSPRAIIGKVLSAADINTALGAGRILSSAGCSAKSCQFLIPENTGLSFAVIVTTKSAGTVAAILQVSSMEKCEIDRSTSRVENGRLLIRLKSLPLGLERIHYIAASKTGTQPPWAGIEEARNHTMSSVTVQEYQRDGMILITPIPQTDLYISVVGQYKTPDGSTAYSDASRIKLSNRPKTRISCRLTWGSAGIFRSKALAKDCRLIVECAAPETPELRLVCLSDGHIPMRLADPKLLTLHTIPESDSGFPSGQYTAAIPDATWEGLVPHSELRLMLSEDDLGEFELFYPDISSLKIP